MNEKILKLLYKNARYTDSELAVMTGLTEQQVQSEIAEMEKAGLIRGYKAVIDWERLDSAKVSAFIELKVEPQPDVGFEQIAERINQYSEVESVYLMSGGFDLCIVVKGKTFQEVAMFVARQLAPMEYVIATSTHFILRRYKDMDVELIDGKTDDRENVLL